MCDWRGIDTYLKLMLCARNNRPTQPCVTDSYTQTVASIVRVPTVMLVKKDYTIEDVHLPIRRAVHQVYLELW